MCVRAPRCVAVLYAGGLFSVPQKGVRELGTIPLLGGPLSHYESVFGGVEGYVLFSKTQTIIGA